MITNVMPILQSFGEVDAGSVVAGVKDAALNFVSDDGFADASAFLTGRRSIEQLSRTTTERLRNAGSMGMSFVDWFTSNAVVRARTKQNMKHGMSFDAAVDEADSFAASLMADRSKGSMPGVFELRNPIVRLFTMFQLEVNNQIGYYTKDLPRRVGQGKGKAFAAAAIAGALAKSFAALFLYNEITERLTGRRAALDPIGTLCTALGIDPTGQLLQKLGIGEAEKDERTTSERLRAAGKEIVGQVPFIGGVTGGGRVPVGAALPRSFTTKEMIKPLIYLVPPTGGGAIKKAVEGIATVRAGGAYDTDKDGRRQLLFPQYGQDFSDYALAAAFGKYRSKEAREYVEGGF